MQFAAVFLFLLSISAAAAEDACPPSEVVKFAELYANPHLHSCQKVSAGFGLVPPMGYPTEPQVKAMCAAEACRALVKDVLALEPADCYLSLSGAKLNAHKMACSFRDACEDDKHRPKPTEHDDKRYYPTPKPTEEKHYKTPKPIEEKYHPTPKPTEDKHYSTSKPTEDKHHPTPKPTKNDKYHDKLEEPKIVKVDHVGNVSSTTESIGKEADKDSHKLKPPMNGTALEFFPMPNTTYKATPEPKAA
ncbi:hypothetical protein PHYSODRAFT_553577 [Phytophthora sojae]|uniref:Elicitin-like protein n=1 Tax=Phytophthora sojae (strain P6497) TaxID=1094619 RepID=G4YQW3_PHYSP|nr:hypothetical protein PHYSODRAFT_553577 [Phytophthora sojae]EGZ30591.1 hypothetical protein PHYSODRAFT_553577 [Phytophthora sojae]|eukprot:XP_009517866.1 hypothetical protein PHYSODRAFT_553577 [Phytophthora sojae]